MEQWNRKRKRITALFLAAVLAFVPFTSFDFGMLKTYAKSVAIRAHFSGNLLKNGAKFTFYGKKAERTGMWSYQAELPLDSGTETFPVFCMEPEKRMHAGATGEMRWYTLGEDPLPGGITLEQAEAMYYALVIAGNYPGTQGKIANLKGNYMMVQSAVWAILSDEWDIDTFKEEVKAKILPNASDPKVGPQLMKYVDEYLFNAKDMCNPDSVPEFGARYENLAPTHKMEDNGDGTYSITFATNGTWQQNYLQYQLERPEGWEVKKQGDQVTFICKNGDPGSCGLITGRFEPGTRWDKYWHRATKLGIIIPTGSGGSGRQMQVALAGEKEPWAIYFRLGGQGGAGPSGGASQGGFTLDYSQYLHEETFRRSYKIELDKLCWETGKPLKDSHFQVLEQFDFSQLDGTNLDPGQFEEEGQEGNFRELSVCQERVVTDSQGHFSHQDEKTYFYEKTYCGGHPEPEVAYAQAGDEATDEDLEAADEENQRLEEEARQAWQECVDWCQDNCHYHDIEEGMARAAMEADRDMAYDGFINLERVYAVREILARGGYILHGFHRDDLPIEMVAFSSSQAGGKGRVVGTSPGNGFLEADLGNGSLEARAAPSVSRNQAEVLERPHGRKATASVATPSTGRPGTATSNNATPITFYLSGQQVGGDDPGGGGWAWDGVQLESQVPFINQEGRPSGDVGHGFTVINHRTEGEIHINKRDLELYQQDPSLGQAESYGKTQGDATLQGAVYGLYAYDDIVHPDGVTGRVFQAGDLVSVAATDQNGDASFLVITQVSDASKDVPNLCHENKVENGNQWIGRPLLLGNYFVQEITRSEGYELSITGMNQSESNRKGKHLIIEASGQAQAGELSHRLNQWDGSWNDVEVTYFKTKGYDLVVTGHPEGTRFYQVTESEQATTGQGVIGMELVEKKNPDGTLAYKQAAGGEFKTDSSGNKIPQKDPDGNLVYGTIPNQVAFQAANRLNLYKTQITYDPLDPEKEASSSIDPDYIIDRVGEALAGSGYKNQAGREPWQVVELSGGTNGDMIGEILTFCLEDAFWDAYQVGKVWQEAGHWKALVHYGYQALKSNAIYEPSTGRLFVREKTMVEEAGKGEREGCYYVEYQPGELSKNGMKFAVAEKKAAGPLVYGKEIILETVYEPEYETYGPGELMLDSEGDPMVLWEYQPVYGQVESVDRQEERKEIAQVAYDKEKGTYLVHVDTSHVNWEGETRARKDLIRVEAPRDSIEVDGLSLAYADYLKQYCQASVAAFASKEPIGEGSYRKEALLFYPGQERANQDGGTREIPLTVLQRVIRQPIQVTKDIALDSYQEVNSYKIHRDPFTVLFGGYLGGQEAKTMKGFYFKLYLKSSLVNTGLLERAPDGTYDYQRFFQEHPEFQASLAIPWDNPQHDIDGDRTTVHANRGGGKDDYWGTSLPLPYGSYVLVEQQPETIPTKHYQIQKPREIVLPMVPQVDPDGTVHDKVASKEFLYDSHMDPEELSNRYLIRFNEESHVIKAHNHDGDFLVFKYGLDKDLARDCGNERVEQYYRYGSISEDKGVRDGVYYEVLYGPDGTILDYGVTKDQVATMAGVSVAVDRQYASALVPWSVLEPGYGVVIDGQGNVGNRETGLEEDGSFNYVAYGMEDVENRFYRSRIRIEKLDGETGENIIHQGALFKIYAAMRHVSGDGATGVEGSGKVVFHPDGSPMYDEREQIFLKNPAGGETGTFKAFSTELDVAGEKRKVGYIETCQPLGAGTYVLVEVEAPEGYVKSRPIAFEVYSDKVEYYPEGGQGPPVDAPAYQYVREVRPDQGLVVEDTHQIEVKNMPTHAQFHKTEQGGKTITYRVTGTEDQLRARGDVTVFYNPDGSFAGYGYVSKTYDSWSQEVVEGTEEELKAMAGVELVYDASGAFAGHGIRYANYVGRATLTLYQGLALKKDGNQGYQGVEVKRNWNDSVIAIIAHDTGSRTELRDTGQLDENKNKIWDTVTVDNPPAPLWRYDLRLDPLEREESTGILYGLDDRGNRICQVDGETGLAYATDQKGNHYAWILGQDGKKIMSQSIQVHQDAAGGQTIYTDLDPVLDENGLPVYYKDGKITLADDEWATPLEGGHLISRLPFGAYILEETMVPHSQGFIQAQARGIWVDETTQLQHFYISNDFTKLEVSKIDMATGKELADALLALYHAVRVPDGSPRGWHLEIALGPDGEKQVFQSWLSGYAYDDQGRLKLDGEGNPIPSSKPRWIDHVPVGDYILEETLPPTEAGYVKADSIEVFVKETGQVQGAVLEDDHTSVEFLKTDGTGRPLPSQTPAQMALYQAVLNEAGEPTYDEAGRPIYDLGKKVFSWWTEDGKEVAATAHQVVLPGSHVGIGYDYDIKPVPGLKNGVYYVTETGAVHIDYLPVGKYVWVEERPPVGMAGADPVYVNVLGAGSRRLVQAHEMANHPIRLEIHKTGVAGGKELFGAKMAIYKADAQGGLTMEEEYLHERWVSGTDGVYTQEDKKAGNIPAGLEVGDLRIHVAVGIPAGRYYLVEEMAPFGFLKAAPIAFTIKESDKSRQVEMVDQIPFGRLEIYKHGENGQGHPLSGAKFRLTNLDTGEKVVLITGPDGKAASDYMPIGRIHESGAMAFYTYQVEEVSAPAGHMLDGKIHEFQFEYQDQVQEWLAYQYDASNQANQVKVSKKDLASQEELPGALMEIRPVDEVVGEDGSLIYQEGEVFASWISTNQPYYVNQIPEGKYVLIEKEPPSGGYALAEKLYFEVKENMTQVPSVTMFDKPTRVEVEKVDGQSLLPLPGASLRLIKDLTGETMGEWTSGQEAQVFHALEPGTYTLWELESPKGYARMEPAKIQVEKSWEPQVFSIKNYPIEVELGKVDREDEARFLPGADFQLVRCLDQQVVRQWVSGLEREVVKGLEPGAYLVVERKPPAGYQKMEPARIEVTDQPGPQVFLFPNEKIQVEIQKVDGKNGALLKGARLQLEEAKTGKVVAVWTTGLKSQEFRGLAPGEYLVRELEAPLGYRVMNPVAITIGNDPGVQVFQIKNYEITHSHGGGGDEPKARRMSIRKTDLGGKPLAGSSFAIYDGKGKLYAQGTTGEDGRLVFETPPAGTYYYRETKAPDGHYPTEETYSFTVRPDGLAEGQLQVANVPKATIYVVKKDALTGQMVPGCKFQVLDRDGHVLHQGVTGEEGSAPVTVGAIGTYWIKETEAPEGYALYQGSLEFTVQADGKVFGSTTLYNYPEEQKERKIGRVLAAYHAKGVGGKPMAFGKTGPMVLGARTGDDRSLMPWVAAFVASLVGMAGIWLWKKKKTKGILMVLLPFLASGAMVGDAYGQFQHDIYQEEKTYKTTDQDYYGTDGEFPEKIQIDGEAYQLERVDRKVARERPVEPEGRESFLTVTSQPFLDHADNHVPDETYERDGKIYRLVKYQILAAKMEAVKKEVEEAVFYQEVEQAAGIPQKADIKVAGGPAGQQAAVPGALSSYQLSNYRWVDGFQLPITIQVYDAESYILGDQLVPRDEQAPLAGYERELLELAGLSQDYYLIQHINWSSEPYESGGVLCRDALAEGKKVVADCHAIYRGQVLLEEGPAQVMEAVYRYQEPAGGLEGKVEYEMKAVATYRKRGSGWSRVVRMFQVTVSLALLLVVAGVLVLWIRRRRKKKKEGDIREEAWEDLP